MVRDWRWGLLGGVVLVAGVRAATAAPLGDAPAATEQERGKAFLSLAFEEKKMRREAAKDFPADLWSQDDAFHNAEYKRAKAVAGEKGIRVPDVLLAVDEGLHGRWPRPEDVTLNPSVPPCRPRPIH